MKRKYFTPNFEVISNLCECRDFCLNSKVSSTELKNDLTLMDDELEDGD